jgi:quinol monooxygenase YgiN
VDGWVGLCSLGLLADVQAAMKTHRQSPTVQAKACAAIFNLTHVNKENKAEAGSLGLLGDIQAAMKSHRQSPVVQEAASGAIAILG